MKSSTLTAVALTLLMLLLVLVAAFIFLFQGQLTLRDGFSEAELTIQSLEQQEAALRIEAAAAQATMTAAESLQATTAADSALLESQLVQSEQQTELLETQLTETTAALESVRATQDIYEGYGPLITIIEPQPGVAAIVGQSVDLKIVASDPVGVKAITISIDRELLDTPVTPQPNIIVNETWVPSSAGTSIISVSAVNNNGVTSKSSMTTVQIAAPNPTTTPTPTAE
jgi:hypothetical protein